MESTDTGDAIPTQERNEMVIMAVRSIKPEKISFLKDLPQGMIPDGIQGGDYKIVWDPSKPAEVTAARATFDELRRQRYNAYRADDQGKKLDNQMVTTFDPSISRLIMVPPVAGG
jgi:hypothetical protein